MSLWLQSTLSFLEARYYHHVRENLLPIAPIALPGCLERELAFGERHCSDANGAALFPIRFLWTLEAAEQRNFGLPAGRSRYHPENLLESWERASADAVYRAELEAQGFRFDFDEKTIELTAGWVYIGDHFAEDFLAIEATLGVEILFPSPPPGAPEPAFRELKRRRSEG
jgi:hypothetical protein